VKGYLFSKHYVECRDFESKSYVKKIELFKD